MNRWVPGSISDGPTHLVFQTGLSKARRVRDPGVLHWKFHLHVQNSVFEQQNSVLWLGACDGGVHHTHVYPYKINKVSFFKFLKKPCFK